MKRLDPLVMEASILGIRAQRKQYPVRNLHYSSSILPGSGLPSIPRSSIPSRNSYFRSRARSINLELSGVDEASLLQKQVEFKSKQIEQLKRELNGPRRMNSPQRPLPARRHQSATALTVTESAVLPSNRGMYPRPQPSTSFQANVNNFYDVPHYSSPYFPKSRPKNVPLNPITGMFPVQTRPWCNSYMS